MDNHVCIKESQIVGVLGIGEQNPRNSEGSFLRLEDGRIAFAYARFSGDSPADAAPCDICVVYSWDNGDSFDTDHWETLVCAQDFDERNVMSVTLRRMENGDIGLFYMLKHLKNACPASEYRLRRFKNGFSEVVSDIKCFPNDFDGYLVVNNDRVIKTAGGKWVVPAALHPTAPNAARPYVDGRSSVLFFSSDDDGVTWRQHIGILHLADNYSSTGLQEPGIVELNSGVLYSYARTDRMVQYEAVSIDGGEHWFGPQPSRFSSPDSPMLIKRNPHSGLYYAVWNPTPVCFSNPKVPFVVGRTPFVIAQSVDCLAFSEPQLIESDPNNGYCYPAVEFLGDKTLLLAYGTGGERERGCLNKTVIRKLFFE